MKYFVIFLILIGFVGPAFALDNETLHPTEISLEEHYEIKILGLEDEYMLDEKYSFYFVISGYGYSCASYQVSYPDENGDTTGMATFPLCDSNPSPREFKINFSDGRGTLENTGIKKAGTYFVTVTFEKPNKYFPTTVSKEFRVVESITENFNKLSSLKQFKSEIPVKIQTPNDVDLIISGILEEYQDGQNVSIIIENELDKIMFASQLVPEYTGYFSLNVTRQGVLWENAESFTVKAFRTNIDDEATPLGLMKSNSTKIIAPLKQINLGLESSDVICNIGLLLIQKYDGSPACVKPTTVDKLIERGWTHSLMTYFCFSEYLPVCGVDGVTYGNLCFMEKSGVELKHNGECENFIHPDYELDETEFLQIKNNMENTGYNICDIQLEENTILIELNWIFEGTPPEKMILSKIPSNVSYEIKYLDGYSDYFISKESVFSCED